MGNRALAVFVFAFRGVFTRFGFFSNSHETLCGELRHELTPAYETFGQFFGNLVVVVFMGFLRHLKALNSSTSDTLLLLYHDAYIRRAIMFQRIFSVIVFIILAGCASQPKHTAVNVPQSTVAAAPVPTVPRVSAPIPSVKPEPIRQVRRETPKPQEKPTKKLKPAIKPLMITAKDLIRVSRAGYSGNCACPYDTDRAGRSCGRRSAYSRPGGASPLCYERDITPDMIARANKHQ